MLSFAMDLAYEQKSQRVDRGLRELGHQPHARDVLRVMLAEMCPLHAGARAAGRLSAAYVLEALPNENIRAQARDGITQGRALVEQLLRQAISDGRISPDRDPVAETNLLLALTGFTTLIELDVVQPQDALTAVDQHLDRLFITNGSGHGAQEGQRSRCFACLSLPPAGHFSWSRTGRRVYGSGWTGDERRRAGSVVARTRRGRPTTDPDGLVAP
ncbi:TetR family transcriptional regulator C-terminal domain-containing protein [Streptomyces sp. NPDC001793]|uniref:TetR family transcriptional regulator C-terminal domain-containing protein n=1 Tax=Streptomyces sp. NPDC001793 TaxID=3154657 RepID=UPI0033265926